MFESFYERYEPEEQEVLVLVRSIIGASYHPKEDFWNTTAVSFAHIVG